MPHGLMVPKHSTQPPPIALRSRIIPPRTSQLFAALFHSIRIWLIPAGRSSHVVYR